jgi:hypothetical protein
MAAKTETITQRGRECIAGVFVWGKNCFPRFCHILISEADQSEPGLPERCEKKLVQIRLFYKINRLGGLNGCQKATQ